MSSHSEMLGLLQSRPKLFSLPQPFYKDPGFYELDLDGIFYREWILAGVECEIPRAGDYVTVPVGPSSVVVIRDDEGTIRAFFNTCRHRGSRICPGDKGRARALTCPYHQWSYNLKGQLFYAGHMHEGFDPTGIALKPVHVETLGGLIYISLADEPPDFAPFKSAVEPYLAPHGLANAKLAFSSDVVANSNWKLVMENSRECYHCPSRHPELMKTFRINYDPGADAEITAFWQRMTAGGLPCGVEIGDTFRMTRIPFAKGAVSITMDGKPAVSKLLGNVPGFDVGSLRWAHYPTMFTHIMGDYAFFFRILPIGPEQALITSKWLVNRDAVEGRDYDLKTLTETWSVTNDQDLELCEVNQKGVNSVGYQPGPYSQEQELYVIKFVEWYCDTMAARLGAPARTAALVG